MGVTKTVNGTTLRQNDSDSFSDRSRARSLIADLPRESDVRVRAWFDGVLIHVPEGAVGWSVPDGWTIDSVSHHDSGGVTVEVVRE